MTTKDGGSATPPTKSPATECYCFVGFETGGGDTSDGAFRHVVIRSWGGDEAGCLRAVTLLTALFQDKFELYIRTRPESASQINFETGKKRWHGLARFSFKDSGYDVPEIKPGVVAAPQKKSGGLLYP